MLSLLMVKFGCVCWLVCWMVCRLFVVNVVVCCKMLNKWGFCWQKSYWIMVCVRFLLKFIMEMLWYEYFGHLPVSRWRRVSEPSAHTGAGGLVFFIDWVFFGLIIIIICWLIGGVGGEWFVVCFFVICGCFCLIIAVLVRL